MKNSIEFKHKPLFKYFVLLLAFSLFGCEDVIQVDLETGENKIVIDAEILWQKGTDGSVQTIKITRMTGFYNPAVPKVSGAEVYIVNSEGISFVFNESEEPGVYVCTDFVPELNGIYTLYVKVADQTYTASETMMPVSEINRVEQEVVEDFGGEEMKISIYFSDPENETNFYLADFASSVLLYPEYELTDDEFFNGNEIMSEFSDEDLKPGDTVEITHRGISHQFHDYMNLMLEVTDSGPFSAPAANIRGNIANQSNPGNYALGYFRLCESDHISYIVK